MKLRGFLTGGVLALALALTGCGGGNGSGNTGGTGGSGGTGNTGGTGGSGGAAAGTTLTVGTDKAAELKFEPTTITAPANTQVSLVFNNESNSVPHNLKFQEGIQAGTSDNVAAGASETIQFTTPAAGDYKYICSIHPGMEGTLTVQ